MCDLSVYLSACFDPYLRARVLSHEHNLYLACSNCTTWMWMKTATAIRLPYQCLMLPYCHTVICLYYQCTYYLHTSFSSKWRAPRRIRPWRNGLRRDTWTQAELAYRTAGDSGCHKRTSLAHSGTYCTWKKIISEDLLHKKFILLFEKMKLMYCKVRVPPKQIFL